MKKRIIITATITACLALWPHSGTQGKTGGECSGNDDSLFHYVSSSLDVK